MKAMNGIVRILKQEGVEFVSVMPVGNLTHACAEEGLRIIMMRDERFAVALAEMCILGNVGATIELGKVPRAKIGVEELLFSESNARFIIATKQEKNVLNILREHRVPGASIGVTGADSLEFLSNSTRICCRLDEMKDTYFRSIERLMED